MQIIGGDCPCVVDAGRLTATATAAGVA